MDYVFLSLVVSTASGVVLAMIAACVRSKWNYFSKSCSVQIIKMYECKILWNSGSIAIGYQAVVSFANSIAFGNNVVASQANQIAVGTSIQTVYMNTPIKSYGLDAIENNISYNTVREVEVYMFSQIAAKEWDIYPIFSSIPSYVIFFNSNSTSGSFTGNSCRSWGKFWNWTISKPLYC